MCSSNFAFKELVLRRLRASPLMKLFLMPGGWQESKCVYWKVSVGLKCVRTSRIECFLNRSSLYTHVCKNVISVSVMSERQTSPRCKRMAYTSHKNTHVSDRHLYCSLTMPWGWDYTGNCNPVTTLHLPPFLK